MKYAASARSTSILIVGLGGQGILHLSKVLAFAAQRKARFVCRSEFRGLSQRGGSVQSAVRYGQSPVVPILDFHSADLILSMDALEAVRALDFLSEDGLLLTDSAVIPPLHVVRSWERQAGNANILAGEFREKLSDRLSARMKTFQFDLNGLAKKAGHLKTANMVLLGAASWFIPFSLDELHLAIKSCVMPALLEPNLAAFGLGREVAKPKCLSTMPMEQAVSVLTTSFVE